MNVYGTYLPKIQCCGSGINIPDKNFSISDPGSASKNLSILTQKIVSKLSERWSGLFIPDPDPDFLPIPDPGSRGQKGSGSGTLLKSTGVKFIWENPSYFPFWHDKKTDSGTVKSVYFVGILNSFIWSGFFIQKYVNLTFRFFLSGKLSNLGPWCWRSLFGHLPIHYIGLYNF